MANTVKYWMVHLFRAFFLFFNELLKYLWYHSYGEKRTDNSDNANGGWPNEDNLGQVKLPLVVMGPLIWYFVSKPKLPLKRFIVVLCTWFIPKIVSSSLKIIWTRVLREHNVALLIPSCCKDFFRKIQFRARIN